MPRVSTGRRPRGTRNGLFALCLICAPTHAPLHTESGHGKADYLRVAPRTEEERLAARKAARLSLDTSAHGESCGGGARAPS